MNASGLARSPVAYPTRDNKGLSELRFERFDLRLHCGDCRAMFRADPLAGLLVVVPFERRAGGI